MRVSAPGKEGNGMGQAYRSQGVSAQGLVHINQGIADFLRDLRAEAEQAVECLGGFRGPVRPPQRRWSRTLDLIERGRHEGGA